MSKKNNKFKQGFKSVAGSLIRNSVVIENAKGPFWKALIIGVIGVWLPVMPIINQIRKTNGGDILDASVQDYDHQFVEVCLDLQDKGYVFKINNSNELLGYKNNTLITRDANTQKEMISHYDVTTASGKEYGLQVYYSDLIFSDKKNKDNKDTVSQFITDLSTKYYNSNTFVEASSEATENIYLPSLLVLSKEGIYLAIAVRGSNKYVNYTNYAPSLKGINPTNDLLGDFLKVYKDDNTLMEVNKFNTNYCRGVMENLKKHLNKSYIPAKKEFMGFSSLVYGGVYGGLVLFMATLLFLLTRGKRNMFNYLTYNDVAKMSGWAALSPGLLGMIMGFLIPRSANMLFILFFGMRIMWMSMKQLRPQ